MTSTLILGLALLWSYNVTGKLVNRTVDDTFPDPVTGAQISYHSSDPQKVWGNSGTCNGCTAHPDPAHARNGTWHDGTFDPGPSPIHNVTASLTFSGTAVFVYCIIPSSTQSPIGFADFTFYIDGVNSGVFTRTPPGNAGYNYDVLVFAQTDIKDGQHTLMIQNGREGVQTPSLLLLDYVIYTTDDGEDDQNKSTPGNINSSNEQKHTQESRLSAGAVAGLVVGIVLFFIGVGTAGIFIWRRKHRNQLLLQGAETHSERSCSPFVGSGTSHSQLFITKCGDFPSRSQLLHEDPPQYTESDVASSTARVGKPQRPLS